MSKGNLRTFYLIAQLNAVALERLAFRISLSQRRQQEAKAQYELLRKFNDEYTVEFQTMCWAGVGFDTYHNFRQFLVGLQSSLDRQKEVIVRLEVEHERLVIEVQSFKQKKERYQKIIARKNHQLATEFDKRGQKDADHYAQLRHIHNGVDLDMPTDLGSKGDPYAH